MISAVKKVVVPVDDQEVSKLFLGPTSSALRCTERDETFGDERWIEVEPPDGSVVLVLSRRTPDEPRRDVPDVLPHSNVFFDCDDLERTYGELRERGVRFPVRPARMHFGWWSMFQDPEGTRFALGQWRPSEGRNRDG